MRLSNPAVLSSSVVDQIRLMAFELGFDRCEAAPLKIPPRDQAAYTSWRAQGFAGGMAYMIRDPEKRLHPEDSYAGLKTVLSLGVSYYQGPQPTKPGAGYGRVARYAWGLDYHTVLMDRLRLLQSRIQGFLGEASRVVLAVDTKPLLERALAQSAGVGFTGKNTVLIAPRQRTTGFHVGSWIFLAELLLDVALEEDRSAVPFTSGCGACTKCLTACPTSAFDGPHRLIAHRCIAYLTIENKGWIPQEMRRSIGDWIFGCDLCQEVCPFNERAYQTRWPEFQAEQGVGPWVSLEEILTTADQKSFEARWGRTPLSRPKRRGMIRNACVAAGNSQEERLIPSLRALLTDTDPVIRGHALGALGDLGTASQVRPLAERMLSDPDSKVREECCAVLN